MIASMQWKDETRDQDPLYSLMLMCKESEGKRNQDAYVRLVNAGPYPMMVLTFDWMLDDLTRFCTDPNQFSIVGSLSDSLKGLAFQEWLQKNAELISNFSSDVFPLVVRFCQQSY